VSSRDRSGRPGGNDRSSTSNKRIPEGNTARQNRANEPWDIDPAEIDRYLSGRPTREQEAADNQRSRRQQDTGTAGQLDQFQRQRSQASRQQSYRPPSTGREQFIEPEDEYPEDTYTRYSRSDDVGYDDEEYGYADDPYVEPEPQRPPRRQVRRPVYHEDEELYADDPYLIYDDERAEPAPARRRPRQSARPSMPAIPKVTVPKAISHAEIVNDIPSLSLIGAAVVSVAIMAIVVSNRLDHLPATIPTHVSANGIGEAIRGRNAIWSVPLLAGALSLMNIAAGWFLARMDMFATRFLLGASLLVQFIAWIAVIKYLW